MMDTTKRKEKKEAPAGGGGLRFIARNENLGTQI